MSHLSLSLLGAFQATVDNQPISGFATNKVRALLAYLVVECDRTHSRETLAGLLWPEFPNRTALGNLRYALNNLRQAIGDHRAEPPFLFITRDTIQFNAQSDYSLDVATLPQLTTALLPISEIQLLISTYRGRFLDGFSCDSAPFEEWVLLKREQTGQQFLRALRDLTAYYEERSEYEQVQIWAHKQLELEPWDEEAYRQLMHALAAGGQRNAALAQYENCRRVLKAELGVEPSRETLALYESIRDETLKSRERTNVPIPLTDFVGRLTEIVEIKSLLVKTRLLTLCGAGGCGKSRLAMEVATALANAHDFSDGVWWIDLAALNDPGLVPQTVASVLGLREAADSPILNLLLNYLRSKATLVVFDNCEHLIDACASTIEALLSACPNMRIMVTSRQALGVNGEVVWRVPSLALPGPNVTLEALQEYDAIRLFNARVVSLIADWTFAAHAPAVVTICRRLEGIPLAIELAVARLKLLSAEQIAARLGDRFNLLTGGSRTALPRHQTLRATMDWSYDLLTQMEQSLLRQLSVFAGGFTLEAVEFVCAGGQGSERAEEGADAISPLLSVVPVSLLDLLTALVDKSLVVVERKTNATRYRLLETVREYAAEKLGWSDEAKDVRNQHLEFYAMVAVEAESHLRRTEQTVWLDRLELENDNMRASLAWSLDGGRVSTGLRLAGALGEFWHLRGYLTEGRQWLKKLLADNQGAPTLERAKAILQAGLLALQQGSIVQASSFAEESLALYRELNDTPGIAGSLLLQGITSHFEGNDRQAAILLEESVSLFQKVEDRDGYAYALLWAARGKMRRGEYDRATTLLESSSVIFQRMGDKDNLSFALGSLGDLARHQGDYVRAADLRRKSLRLAWEAGSRVEVSYALEQLAMIASLSKQPERAARLWGASEVMRESLNRYIARSYEVEYNPAVANVSAQLGEKRFAAVWKEGRTMTTEQVVNYALKDIQYD